jgi:branched-subunit amino acid ABC-type transport system permease component
MSMTTILQHCLTGISLGGAYALIAIGYTLVYGILRLINFAHGDIFMMAGYFMILPVHRNSQRLSRDSVPQADFPDR